MHLASASLFCLRWSEGAWNGSAMICLPHSSPHGGLLGQMTHCGASAIAARCISTCSALHPAQRPSAILTTPAIQRLRNKSAAPCHQASKPFQTLPPLPLSHFKSIPLSLPDSPHHPSPSAQSPPSSPPACVRLPTRNCRFTYPPLPSSIPKTTTRLPYPAPRPATAHKKTAPNPVKIVL